MIKDLIIVCFIFDYIDKIKKIIKVVENSKDKNSCIELEKYLKIL